MKELAVEFGLNRVTVSAYLRRAEIPVRPVGLGPQEMIEMIDLYKAGWSSGRPCSRLRPRSH
jgi:hypothetical protein